MIKTRWMSLGALAMLATAHAPIRAQGTSQTVQLAFGYECGDRFLVRNDGTAPVVIEYAVAGSQDKSQLHLNGRQSAEIASAQDGNMELWVGGKVVASEPKGSRVCNARNGNAVSGRPVEQSEATEAQPADTTYRSPAVVVYGRPYDYFDYYDYGYPYPYAYYGYSPFFYPSVSVYARGGFGRFGGFGGFGRGFGGRGPVGRGRGRR
jgi:hypothetical protein